MADHSQMKLGKRAPRLPAGAPRLAAIFLAALLSGCAAPPAAAAIGWVTLGAAATAATAAATGTVLNVQMIKKNDEGSLQSPAAHAQ